MIIQGNFRPPSPGRFGRVVTRSMAVIFGLVILGSLIIYGYKLQVQATLNNIGAEAKFLSEANKELLVELHRIQSYENVSVAANQVPTLQEKSLTIEVPTTGKAATRSVPVALPDLTPKPVAVAGY